MLQRPHWYDHLHRTTLLSWGYDGGSHWSFSLGGIIPLPLVDSTGGVIAADGYTLVGYYGDGTPRGDPVLLYPTQGEIFDLTIATGVDVVVLLYKCGFLAAYLTSKPLPLLTVSSGYYIKLLFNGENLVSAWPHTVCYTTSPLKMITRT